MCQLLGMSCKEPANINFSFEGFRARGGLTDEHSDGWGIAFFRNNQFDVIVDHQAAANSPLAADIARADIKSKTIVAHIRKATVGEVSLVNCHPFQRNLWGKPWLFCHNGHLKQFNPPLKGNFKPEGETDSEWAFCFLLESLAETFAEEPPASVLFEFIHGLAHAIEKFGVFNIILSNGDLLFTFCSTSLAYVERKHPFSRVTLVDKDVSLDLSQHNTAHDKMILIATKPLTTNEPWVNYNAREARLFREGELLFKS